MSDAPEVHESTPDAPARVYLRDKYGQRYSISADKADRALTQGFRPETADESRTADVEKKFGGLGGELKAGAAGVARGATAGLSDVLLTKTGLAAPETLEGLKEANPTSSIGGEAAGTLGSLLLPGVGEVSAPALIGKAGAGVAEHLGGSLAARATGAALEGGLFGLGNTLSESSLGSTPVTAQKMVASVGLGALLGGAGMAGLSKLGEAAAPVFGKVADALEAAPAQLQDMAENRALKAAGFIQSDLSRLTDAQQTRIARRLLDQGLLKPGGSVSDALEAIQASKEGSVKEAARLLGLADTNSPVGTAATAAEDAEPRLVEPTRYIHLSEEDMGPSAQMSPRTPRHPLQDNNKYTIEDDFTPRVSFAKSPEKAFEAIKDQTGGTLYVYGADELPGFHDPGQAAPRWYNESFDWLDHAERNDLDPGEDSRREVLKGLVPDAARTGEVWATKPVAARRLGTYNPKTGEIHAIAEPMPATASGGFDVQKALSRAHSELVAPLADNPVRMKAASDVLANIQELAAGQQHIPFELANQIKNDLGEGLFSGLDSKLKKRLGRQFEGIFNDELKTQAGSAIGGNGEAALRDAQSNTADLITAEKAATKGVNRGVGNRSFSLTDHLVGGLGAGVGGLFGGPAGSMLGAALGAGLNKLARDRLPSALAVGLDELASAPWFKTAAESFSGYAKQLASTSPQALGKYAPILTSALGRGPEEALLTHAALSQTDAQYRQTMQANGLDYTQPTGDVAAKAAALAALKQHLDGHDSTTQDAAADALHGKGIGDARLSRSPVLGDFNSGPTKGWQDRLQALNAMAQNPQALAERIAGQLGPLAGVAPQLATAMSATAAQAVQFLQSKAPQTQDAFQAIPALARQWEPSQTDKARFEKYLAAAENPQGALAQLAQGHVTREAVETLRAVYPDLYADMRAKMVNALSSHKTPLSTSQRVALSAFMGQPMDATLRPERLAQLQATYAPAQAQPPETHQAPAKNRELKPSRDATAQAMTLAQRIEGR